MIDAISALLALSKNDCAPHSDCGVSVDLLVGQRLSQGIISSRMRKDTANWIALTDYDLDTARHMLVTGRYLYVVFLCHLVLEKILKAHVAEVTQTVPIKTHDLPGQEMRAGTP